MPLRNLEIKKLLKLVVPRGEAAATLQSRHESTRLQLIAKVKRTYGWATFFFSRRAFYSLTLREEHRLREFENKVLRKIFGAKRDEITGEWRKLHNAELHTLYSSPNIIGNLKSRRLSWAGHVAHIELSRNAYRVILGRPEGKRPLGRPTSRWEDNIKMDLREVGCDPRDWIALAEMAGLRKGGIEHPCSLKANASLLVS